MEKDCKGRCSKFTIRRSNKNNVRCIKYEKKRRGFAGWNKKIP